MQEGLQMSDNQASNLSVTATDVTDLECLNHIDSSVWEALDVATKDCIRKRTLDVIAPIGISKDLWDALSHEEKVLILPKLKNLESMGHKSRVIRFFHGDGGTDPEPAINAMALICALVLSVPYSVLMTIDSNFLESLKAAFEQCEINNFDTAHRLFLENCSGAIYSCIIGLSMASLYYMFKPQKSELISWMRVKGKVLVCLILICTITAIVTAMNLAGLLIPYYSTILDEEYFCDQTTAEYWLTGSVFLGIGTILAIGLMW